MSSYKRGRRRTRSNGNTSRELGEADVTLGDFANSTVTSGQARLKKPVRNGLMEVESFSVSNDIAEESGDGIQEQPTRRRRRAIVERDTTTGVQYPVDVWFLISKYIDIESVGTFARLCKGSLEVLQSAKFWLSLYQRYYKPGISLPEMLQPESMVQRYGMRARVIRALHYMYRPFTLSSINYPITKESVCNRKVVRQWYQINLGSGHWTYFLKLQDINHNIKPIPTKLVEVLDDITINREEGCVILKMECGQFVHIPHLMGMILADIKVTLGTIILGSHARLKFTYSVANTGPAVVVDVVYMASINLIPWWSPYYPHAKHPLPCVTIADSK